MDFINELNKLVDTDNLIEAYNNYNNLKKERIEAQKELDEFEIDYEFDSKSDILRMVDYYLNITDALNISYRETNSKKYKKTLEMLMKLHPEVNEMVELKHYIRRCTNDMRVELNKEFLNSYSEIVVLEKDNKKYLVDLYNNFDIEITKENEKLIHFLIDSLKNKELFIGNIKTQDLPLLMNIKEDIKYNFESQNEFYYNNENIPSQISSELEMVYAVEEKLEKNRTFDDTISFPFIVNSDEEQKKWNELDELKNKITQQKYLLEYYKILMVFGNNVEKVYNNAPEEEKEYVIDAYYHYASEVMNTDNEKYHFRTTSPLINIEVLKRKIMNKK